MNVDWNDLQDLLHMQRAIRQRIIELGGAPPDGDDDGVESMELPSVGDTPEYADAFLNSIGSENTKRLLDAFASFDGEFTLEDVAAYMGVSAEKVRAQKLRLGRTESKLGQTLLDGKWRDSEWKNFYTMHPLVRRRLRERLLSEGWAMT